MHLNILRLNFKISLILISSRERQEGKSEIRGVVDGMENLYDAFVCVRWLGLAKFLQNPLSCTAGTTKEILGRFGSGRKAAALL